MSAVRADTAQPKIFSSLTDLSQALDEAAAPPTASPVLDQWPAAPGTPRANYRGRRTLVDYWPMGFAFAAGLWLLIAGGLILANGGRQSAYAEPMPANQEVTAIPEILEDPVQVGRGGRAPAVLTPEVAPAECLGTRVTFVDTLAEATRLAKEQNKLLMVLNVSGDFEDSRFT